MSTPWGNQAAASPGAYIAGVDGCRAGWVVVLAHTLARDAREHQVSVCASFTDVLAMTPTPAVLAVDMPIGLLTVAQPGGRTCDRLARQLLRRRSSSVFTPPTRDLLGASHYDQVRQHGLSLQAFHILPKIREVDRVMTPVWQQHVYEAHPELAFRTLAGQPMAERKKVGAGREERLRALEQAVSPLMHNIRQAVAQAAPRYRRSQVALDDLLDAYALVHTAWRILHAQAQCLPSTPPRDQRGLRMEIWY